MNSAALPHPRKPVRGAGRGPAAYAPRSPRSSRRGRGRPVLHARHGRASSPSTGNLSGVWNPTQQALERATSPESWTPACASPLVTGVRAYREQKRSVVSSRSTTPRQKCANPKSVQTCRKRSSEHPKASFSLRQGETSYLYLSEFGDGWE